MALPIPNYSPYQLHIMTDPFTLRVFIPSGDPEGTRIVDRMNWTGRAFYVPRDDLSNACNRKDLKTPGVYVLLGQEQDDLGNEFPVAYIGQAEDVRKRISQHDASKDFWDRAMVFVSGNNGLNRAHITWLEWALMAQATKANRSRLENGLNHSEPMLSEGEKADVSAFFNEMLRLMPVMGVHVFEEAKVEIASSSGVGAKKPTGKDVIIVPAKPEGFQSAFLDSQAWWAIRVAKKHRENLKWIAAYQVLPVAAITHLAEIDRFEPYGDEGKFKVVFKGPAEELDNHIPYGNAISGAMQGPRYCTKEVLEKAETVADLI